MIIIFKKVKGDAFNLLSREIYKRLKVFFYLIFIVVEIGLKKKIDKKIMYFLKEEDYESGINYLKNIKVSKIFFDVVERCYYYEGLFYLHKDNILKAKESLKIFY